MLFINLGISFYAHTCLSSGQTSFLFSVTDDPCVDEVKKEAENDACCSIAPEIDSHFEDNCCSTDQVIIQIQDHYAGSSSNSLIQLVGDYLLPSTTIFGISKMSFIPQEKITSWYLAHAPPILQGRQIHLVNEVFRN